MRSEDSGLERNHLAANAIPRHLEAQTNRPDVNASVALTLQAVSPMGQRVSPQGRWAHRRSNKAVSATQQDGIEGSTDTEVLIRAYRGIGPCLPWYWLEPTVVLMRAYQRYYATFGFPIPPPIYNRRRENRFYPFLDYWTLPFF